MSLRISLKIAVKIKFPAQNGFVFLLQQTMNQVHKKFTNNIPQKTLTNFIDMV